MFSVCEHTNSPCVVKSSNTLVLLGCLQVKTATHRPLADPTVFTAHQGRAVPCRLNLATFQLVLLGLNKGGLSVAWDSTATALDWLSTVRPALTAPSKG